jgi:hypothetical protein
MFITVSLRPCSLSAGFYSAQGVRIRKMRGFLATHLSVKKCRAICLILPGAGKNLILSTAEYYPTSL